MAAARKTTVLDLFSGTGSVSKVCALQPDRFECTSLDITDKHHTPTIVSDIMSWNYKAFPPKCFDIIFASPPCTMYSNARRNTPIPRDIEGANKVVKHVLEIVEYFQPVVAVIENPASGCLKKQDFMQDLTSHKLSYCHYSDWGYRKQTQLWVLGTHGLPNFVPKSCLKISRCSSFNGIKHPNTFGNIQTIPVRDKYRVPPLLLSELLSQAQEQVGIATSPHQRCHNNS